MASYTRRIGRNVSNAFPAWRTAMTQTDRLYYVGTQQPSHAPALVGNPTHYGSAGTMPDEYGAGWDVMTGYSSGTWVEDVSGPFGLMVYGTGGHTRLQNQILSLNLNQDSPTFGWWHNPTWKTSDTGSADLYYSPAEEATLIAGARGTAARIRSTNETADAVAWDRQFPVSFDGWIFPRKMTTGQMGDGVPHGFRYSTTQYIPASVTGSDPLYLAINGAQGPFAQSYAPSGVTDLEWMNASALGAGNRRRWPYYFRNCRTGAWTVNQWQPDGINLNTFGGASIGYFSDLRRVYVVAPYVSGGSSWSGWYYLDFTNGIASHTISSATLTGTGFNSYCAPVFSEGDLLGRHFAVGIGSAPSNLTVYNFDAGSVFTVDLSSQSFVFRSGYEKVGMGWDAANKRVLFTTQNESTNALEYWSISVPDTLSSTGWTASKRTPTVDDAAMTTSHFSDASDFSVKLTGFYGKTRYIPRLGVILVPSGQRRMLAFRPSV